MSNVTMVSPVEVEKALTRAPAEYRRMHEMNLSNPLVEGCKLGAVFSDTAGNYLIYVGVNGRNRKFPLIAFRPRDNSFRKMTPGFFAAVRAASKAE